MRWLLLFAALFSPAFAQVDPDVDPDDLLLVLGRPWAEAKPLVAPPDSGRVVGKSGTLLWRPVQREMSKMYLIVRAGVVAELIAVAARSAARDFDELVAEARRELGEPGPDGFYAEDRIPQGGMFRDIRAELRFDEEARTMTLRVPIVAQR